MGNRNGKKEVQLLQNGVSRSKREQQFSYYRAVSTGNCPSLPFLLSVYIFEPGNLLNTYDISTKAAFFFPEIS